MPRPDDVVIISADDAVFWMDANGHWRNAHGRLRHKRTVDYLNRCIGHDQDGWFVRQRRDKIWEKVYFHCPRTALFAIDLKVDNRIVLQLNTGRQTALKPRRLEICDDNLFQRQGPVRIQFAERAAAKLISMIEDDNDQWKIRVGGRRYRIAQTDAAGAQGNGQRRATVRRAGHSEQTNGK